MMVVTPIDMNVAGPVQSNKMFRLASPRKDKRNPLNQNRDASSDQNR